MTIFKSFRLASFAFLLAGTTLAWSQSTRSPHELLGLGAHHSTTLAKRTAVSGALTAAAKIYKFASADFPGAASSLVFDKNTSTVLGDSNFSSGFGFTLTGVNYATLIVPGSSASEATGINTTGAIVGVYVDLSSVTHGFLKKGATVTTMDLAGGTLEPLDINDSGEIVGAFIDAASVTHGFTSPDGVTFTTLDVPGAKSTLAAGVNTAGMITGVWADATNVNHGFIYSGGTFTSLNFPSATNTTAIGINDSGEVAGYYEDAASVFHGFVYSNGVFSTVDVAGAIQTQLTRIKNNGNVTGLYTDSAHESHGVTGH